MDFLYATQIATTIGISRSLIVLGLINYSSLFKTFTQPCTCTLTSDIVGISLPTHVHLLLVLRVYHYLNPADSLDQHHDHLYLYSTRKIERIISNLLLDLHLTILII